MINVDYVSFQSFLREKVKDVSTYKKTVSLALGIAISRMLPLPSSAVDSADYHYSATLIHTANMLACEFNENIVVDIDLVAQTARSYWMIRYTCAHPDIDVPMIATGDFGFLSKVNNVSRFINNDSYKFCDTNSEVLIVIINRCLRLLNQKDES